MDVILLVVGGTYAGRHIPISTREFVIGRGQECQLRLKSDVVSRKHCAIVVENDVAAIEDLGSTNGTFLNGQRIQERQELKNGDRIAVGVLELEIQLGVGVVGKTKPKVHSVQEAAARTVASAVAGDEELDINSWLKAGAQAQEKKVAASPLPKPASADDTVTGKVLTETSKVSAKTSASPANSAQKGAKEKEKTSGKPASRFQGLAKPMAKDSGQAANDILKKFFARKKAETPP